VRDVLEEWKQNARAHAADLRRVPASDVLVERGLIRLYRKGLGLFFGRTE
jgi:hypothetical protein